MSLRRVLGASVLAAAACSDSDNAVTPPEEPPPLPQATEDRVGLPADYATKFKAFYVFDRADNKQVRVVFANDTAAMGLPFKRGSVLVMETYRTRQDAQGNPLLDSNGRFQRDALAGIFVMRKGKWFGLRYKDQQTGEWEYASFRADKSANVVGDAAAQACASCHLDAGPSRDWVYRANIFFAGASGAIPKPSPSQPQDQPFIDNYTFVPATVTVKVGTRVTWTNNDQVKHTVTLEDASFSGLLDQGASLSRTFPAAGTFKFFCAVHPTMRTTVTVQP